MSRFPRQDPLTPKEAAFIIFSIATLIITLAGAGSLAKHSQNKPLPTVAKNKNSGYINTQRSTEENPSTRR